MKKSTRIRENWNVFYLGLMLGIFLLGMFVAFYAFFYIDPNIQNLQQENQMLKENCISPNVEICNLHLKENIMTCNTYSNLTEIRLIDYSINNWNGNKLCSGYNCVMNLK